MDHRGTQSSYKRQQTIGYKSGAVVVETGDQRQHKLTKNKVQNDAKH